MKKLYIFLILISLLLTGCTRKPDGTISTPIEPTEQSEIQETIPAETESKESEPASESPSPTYTQLPMSAVSLPVTTKYHTDGETVIYHYSYQNIYLTTQDQQVADAIIIDYLNRLDNSHAISSDLAEQVNAAYNGNENWTPYYFESLYTPTRIDRSVLSLFGRNVIYAGGNHSQQACIAANYNMITGEVLTLGSILQNVASTDNLSALVVANLQEQEKDLNLFGEYPDVVEERFSRDISFDEDWYFTDNGLSFYFAPYEIAPYSSGIITVEIPYNKLVGILNDEFFPEETDAASGTLRAERLADTDIDNYTQIAELPLCETGEQVFLSCDGILRSLQIDSGFWNEDGTVFTKDATVFACQTLSPGDGIVVITDIPDVMPTLKVTYKAGAQTKEHYITQSGKDGSILLIDGLV